MYRQGSNFTIVRRDSDNSSALQMERVILGSLLFSGPFEGSPEFFVSRRVSYGSTL